MLNLVESLLDKSLLRQEASQGDEPRFRMLETIREYAHERLTASGEAEEIGRRHACYYLALAELAEQELFGAQQLGWLLRLDADDGNLSAALAWSHTTGAHEQSLRLTAALWYYWALRSRYVEGRRWLDQALADARPPAGRVSPVWLAKALNAAGRLAEKHGDLARAEVLLSEALPIYREQHDQLGAAMSLLYLGRVARDRGSYDRAETLEQESLALFRAQGDCWGMSWALFSLGDTAIDQGHTGPR